MSSVVIAGNTSGTVTLAAPDVSGNTTLTLPTANGTVLTSATPFSNGQGPAFSAYVGTTQSFTSATWTKVAANSEVFDTNNNYDSTTNYRFTPTVAGYYQCNGNVSFLFTGTASITGIAIFKNGVATYDTTLYITQNSASSVLTSKLIYMNGSTDYIELYVYCNGTSPSLPIALSNYFQASLVRAA